MIPTITPKRRWGNRYKDGYTKVTMKSFSKQNKKCEYAAQRIRDYFNTVAWNKMRKKSV